MEGWGYDIQSWFEGLNLVDLSSIHELFVKDSCCCCSIHSFTSMLPTVSQHLYLLLPPYLSCSGAPYWVLLLID